MPSLYFPKTKEFPLNGIKAKNREFSHDNAHLRRGPKPFEQMLDSVQFEPVMITRHGQPAAFMISAEMYRKSVNANQKDSVNTSAFIQSVRAFQGKGKGGATKLLLADHKLG